MKVYLNGKFIDDTKAHLSIHDHGFLYGAGVYETMRVYEGRVFGLQGHLKRLQHSLQGLQIKIPWSMKEIGRAMEKTARLNHHSEAVVRLTVTRGPGLYGFDPALCEGKPTLAIVSRLFIPYPKFYHQDGITASIVSIRRNNPRCLPPHVKSTSCVNGILAKMESVKLKAQEGIMLTLDNFLAEGTVSNIFIVKNNVVSTSKLDGTLLSGVTRGVVLDLARKAGVKVQERKVPLKDILSADEVFLTNTTMEVLPITTLINNSENKPKKQKVGTGAVGPITKKLMMLFKRKING